MIKVCLIGIGKTGKEVARMIMEQENMELVAAICSLGSLKKHKDLGQLTGNEKIGVKVESADDLENVILKTKPDVVIDFSTPKATLENLDIVSKMKVNMVIGTTGFSELEIKKIEKVASINNTGIVYAPNITRGVNVLMILTKLATILLNNYDFQISEIHYKNKKDIPSGTAIKIAKEIENGLNYTGKNISDKNIPINSVRAGGIVGKHEVLIAGEYDKLVISHESFSRKVFASGALYAADFIKDKLGFYEMNDVLNLSKVIKDLYMGNDEAALEM
ncbi:4-hydroxy-tetrahydrodipicolinate reductase [Clostridium neuense]|uniref:4-hydroxy-tetrahydrodipicolinate reductase n=1 Tax=Clostridium neuense TaxID=1728934 RepID=A0ABW8TBN5_9CLOT